MSSAVLALLLAGCGQGETNSSDSSKDDKNHQTQKKSDASLSDLYNSNKSKQHDTNNNKHESQSKKGVYKSFDQLTKADKIALAILAPPTSEWMLTPSQIFNDSRFNKNHPMEFIREVDFKEVKRPSNADILVATEGGNGGVKFDFHVKVAINDTQIAVLGEKGAILKYKEIFEYGKVYNIKDLYEKYKSDPDLPKIVSLISVDETYHPDTRNLNTDSDSDSDSSSSSSETVTRANVIDKVEAYEGHKLDTSKYTYKEPEQMGDGRWGFSILDKAGNLEGSYIINADGSVEKYDAKGRRI